MDEFAAALKARRETAGLSVEDLFQRTRINMEFLEAIEAGSFDVLPSVYLRLFLKKYAQEVGLDVEETLRSYEIASRPPPPPENPIKSRQRESSTTVPVIAALGVLVIIVSLGFWALNDTEAPQSPQVESLEMAPKRTLSRASDQATTTPSETTKTTPDRPGAPGGETAPLDDPEKLGEAPKGDRVVSAYSLSPGFPINRQDSILVLSVIAKEATGISVRADERSVFEGLLTVGSQRTWEAITRIRVEIEKADALTLSLQGNPLKPLGKAGRKLRLFISRASIWVEEIEPAAP
mgnify:CR=1 FL=1|tara:strand:+ start:31 stop:909 length:879 start_codon:yes stop_codon:yes gene_type:complete